MEPNAPNTRRAQVALRADDLPLRSAYPGGGGDTAWQLAIAIALGPRVTSPNKNKAALSLPRQLTPPPRRR